MIVSLIKGTKINNLKLPDVIRGSFWVTDYDNANNINNIINIEASNGEWKMFSNEDVSIISDNEELESIVLSDYSFYILKLKKNDNLLLLYCSPSYDKSFKRYLVDENVTIKIGSSIENNICFDSYGVDEEHAKIEYNDGNYYIVDNNSRLGTYVNNIRVRYQQKLSNGDIIFITGLKIIILMEKDKLIFYINNPNESISIDDTYLKEKTIKKVETNNYDDSNDKDELSFEELYKFEDYFHKRSRKKKSIDKISVHIDPPPSIRHTMPFIYNIIPMFTILIILLLVGISITVNKTLTTSTFVFCLVILIVMFSWYLWLKEKFINTEEDVKRRYIEYVKSKQKKIKEQMDIERDILRENNLSLEQCQKTILKHRPFLWERKIHEDDFLNVNLGEGTLPVNIEIDYPSDHIDTDDEILTGLINELNNDYKYINNAPVILNLKDNYKLGLAGSKKLNKKYIDRLILQLISYHSYDDLKIVILTTKNNESSWDYIKILPHIWDNDKLVRYFASTEEEITNLCNLLYKEYKRNIKEEKIDHHYLIITDNYKNIRNYNLITSIINSNKNNGFELIMLSDSPSGLPSECSSYIDVTEKESILYDDKISFEIDYDTPINMYECCRELANIPLDINTSVNIPTNYDFLEMFNVGTVEQLNSINRWNYNNPTLSLKTKVGIGNSEEDILLDIHEKYHGPNGIISGSSGSGKTNFLITYILSMAVNYHPSEVQFILVDQENGELINTFDNKELCIKLPHLVGTIKDYSTSEINRVIFALKLELDRRKELFNKIKDYVGDSNMDIYKYQNLYRQNKVKEPLSHIIIVVDKYEELKYTNQKFLQSLNTIVRMGRLYGLHIIYSSSEYVEDQIYSNSRFKINLNMSDGLERSINSNDNFLLDKIGRFYLQKGNDISTLGLAAFSKAKYYPSIKHKREINTSIDFVDNTGFIYKSKDKNQRLIENAQGNILNNTLLYLDSIKNKEKIKIDELWLNSIPNIITVTSLINKYKGVDSVSPIVGEYDNPYKRKQDILRFNMIKHNALIYSINHKELVINSILYSSLKEYSPIDVNYYIIDLDKELLGSFTDSPLVGNVIYNGEEDKINRLFNYLDNIIEDRKKLFSIYGDVETYNNTNELKVPIICTIINNYEIFNTTYNKYNDKLIELLKIGHKYGICFIMSAGSPNNLSLNIKQGFDNIYSLDISKEDYLSLYNMEDFDKSFKTNGRGLVKIDDYVYEFQTAVTTSNYKEEYEHIKNRCLSAQSKYKVKALEIPTLPSRITFKDIKKNIGSIDELIIGYNAKNLSIVKYDYTKAFNIITGENIKSICNFTSPLIKQFSAIDKSDLIVIDATIEKVIKSSTNIKLVNNSFNSNFINLEKFINEYYAKYLKGNIKSTTRCTNIFICGLDRFVNELSSDNQARLASLFKKIKEINVINIIIIDTIRNIEKYETSLWYNLIDNSDGIWVGSGISNQFSIRINKITKELCEDIPDNFCYVVNKGEPILVQFIENYNVSE